MNESKKGEVLQLLRDYRTWFSPFGGALAPEDSHIRSADYGPAGLIFSGTEFDREDRRLVLESLVTLWGGMMRLQRVRRVGSYSNGDPISGMRAYNVLREYYVDDPADHSIIEHWRGQIAELEQENERRAKQKPPKPPRVALVTPKRTIEAHNVAVLWLASNEPLLSADLHVVFPARMTEDEEKKMERQNADIYAKFQALRVSGLSSRIAIEQTAKHFRHSGIDAVERIVEFRAENKLDECTWGGCERAPFSQNLCMKHYAKQRRNRKKAG